MYQLLLLIQEFMYELCCNSIFSGLDGLNQSLCNVRKSFTFTSLPAMATYHTGLPCDSSRGCAESPKHKVSLTTEYAIFRKHCSCFCGYSSVRLDWK